MHSVNEWQKTAKLELVLDDNTFMSKLSKVLDKWNIHKDKDGFYRCSAKTPKDFIEAGAYEILEDNNVRMHIKKCEISYSYENNLYIEDFLKQMNENNYL